MAYGAARDCWSDVLGSGLPKDPPAGNIQVNPIVSVHASTIRGAFCKIRQVAGFFTRKGKGTGQLQDKSDLCCIMEMSNRHDERRWSLPLKQTLLRHWFRFQRELFPWLEEALGPLGDRWRSGHQIQVFPFKNVFAVG